MAYRLRDRNRVFKTYSAILPNLIKRRRLDTDNVVSEPLHKTQKSSRVASYKPSNVIAGVTFDNLPIPPLDTDNPIITHYLDPPVMRTLHWNVDEFGVSKRRELASTRALIAGFVQTRGEVAKTPCLSCVRGKGLWKECVIGSDAQENKLLSDSCANCRWSNRFDCTYRTNYGSQKGFDSYLLSPGAHGSRAYHSPPVTPPASTGTLRRFTLTAPRPPQRVIHLGDGDGYKAEDRDIKPTGFSHPVKTEQEDPFRVPSIHDGKVIPFSLTPDAIDDLSFLKQAAADLAGHFAVVERRIAQLEEEASKRDVVNPWDLL